MDEAEFEELKELFASRSEECEGCPFFIEWEERKSWLDYFPEGRVMCGLLGGMEGNPRTECQIMLSNQEREDEDE